jgi:hypothetical protein
MVKPLLVLPIATSLLTFANVIEAWGLSSLHPASSARWLTSTQSTLPTRRSSLHSALQTDEDITNIDVHSDGRKIKNSWFPIKPADALSPSNGYDSLVKSAYLRHVLVSTEEMVDLIMAIYLKGGSLPGNDETYGPTDGDVFTRLARDVSLCADSREDGGKIGWVDNPCNECNDDANKLDRTNRVAYGMLDLHLIKRLFQERVKGGDVLKLQATDGNGWHLIRVDDLYIDVQPSTMVTSGTKNIINRKRNKLKGLGTIPLSPTFRKLDVDNYNGIENDDMQSKKIYSVPNAQVSSLAKRQ